MSSEQSNKSINGYWEIYKRQEKDTGVISLASLKSKTVFIFASIYINISTDFVQVVVFIGETCYRHLTLGKANWMTRM
jgi:hypothetical protein